MEFRNITIKIKDLAKNYTDDGDGGVFAFDNKLVVRPPYQREFIYDDKKRDAVMDTVIKGYPLNLMWWAENEDGTYELMDGQQRTISVCQYVHGDYSFNGLKYDNLAIDGDTKKKIDEYELMICVCKGTSEEKLNWFKTINIAGEKLTNQELLNSAFTGAWLSDAKKYFSKRDCVAKKISDGFVKGNPIRQEYLETALEWITNRDGLNSVEEYMANHQHDKDAYELWNYFRDVVEWANRLFPNVDKKYTNGLAWGLLYNKYKNNDYDVDTLEEEVRALAIDYDVTKISGIIPYLLSDRTSKDEKLLSIRTFDERDKMRKYEEQGHKCACCGKVFSYDDMQGDHIIPWSKGGHTIYENLQMLCRECNNNKSDN